MVEPRATKHDIGPIRHTVVGPCVRCAGLLLKEGYPVVSEADSAWLTQWRCVNCGHVEHGPARIW